MTGVLRQGVDVVGGLIQGGSSDVFVNGKGLVRIGDAITPHGTGPHATSKMSSGSSTVFANGIGVCRVDDSATCVHVASSGSEDVFAG
jgi:uncharacterized Zn-binding protein involved in type VI secretion